MSVILYSELNNAGNSQSFDHDTPNMPAGWDASSKSCIIDQRDVPCWFCSEPNYQGLVLRITNGGGCNDLDRLPGQWNNKIRSIKFGHGLDGLSETVTGRLQPSKRAATQTSTDESLYSGFNTIYFVDRFMTGNDVWDIEWSDVQSGGPVNRFTISHPSSPIAVSVSADPSGWSQIVYRNLTLNSLPVDDDFLHDGQEIPL